MYCGNTYANNIKPGDYVIPPRNFGKLKKVAMVLTAGQVCIFVFEDASKMSVNRDDKVSAGFICCSL